MRYTIALTAAALVALGLNGGEAKAHACPYTDMVYSWYHRYLNRAPDPSGLNTWVSALRCGADPRDVEASILASEEYFCRHGHSGAGFVTGLYTDVLGRTPCAHEVEDWMCRLRQVGCRKRLSLEFFGAAGPELAARVARPGVHRHKEVRHGAPVLAPVVARPVAPVHLHPSHGGRFDPRFARR